MLRRDRADPATRGEWCGHVPIVSDGADCATVRLTDFWERMELVLGPAYAHSWAHDVVLPPLGLTVEQAIADGVETKAIWRAVCATTEVPGTLR